MSGKIDITKKLLSNRLSQFLLEYDRTISHLEEIKSKVKFLADILHDENYHCCSKGCMSLIQKMDELTYPILELNIIMEDAVIEDKLKIDDCKCQSKRNHIQSKSDCVHKDIKTLTDVSSAIITPISKITSISVVASDPIIESVPVVTPKTGVISNSVVSSDTGSVSDSIDVPLKIKEQSDISVKEQNTAQSNKISENQPSKPKSRKFIKKTKNPTEIAKPQIETKVNTINDTKPFSQNKSVELNDPMEFKVEIESTKLADSDTTVKICENIAIKEVPVPDVKVVTLNNISDNQSNDLRIEEEIQNTNKTNSKEISTDSTAVQNLKMTVQPMYSIDDKFECIVVHIENPHRFYVIPIEIAKEYRCFVREMNEYYSNKSEIQFNELEELLQSGICNFAVKVNNDFWCRALLINSLHGNEDIEVFCVDNGMLLNVKITELHILAPQFQEFHPMAYECRLDLIEPLSGSNGKWSDESLQYLNNLIFEQCSIIIADILDNVLVVHLKHNDKEISMELMLKNFAQLSEESHSNDDSKSTDPVKVDRCSIPDSVQMHSNDFVRDNFGVDVNIRFEGTDYVDEQIICKNYKGPPDTTCFKGSKCKKIHQLFNKDGWTIQKVHIKIVPEIELPPVKSVITLIVTAIRDYKHIYVQVLKCKEEIPTLSMINDKYSVMHKKFFEITESMNTPKSIQSMKLLKQYPAIGEIVAAFHPDSKMWHRARVLCMCDKSADLYYIDYGTTFEDINFNHIRKLNDEYMQLPCQAISCVISNVNSTSLENAQRAEDMLINMTLNKTLTAVVRISEEGIGLLGINLMDESSFDIGEMLCVSGLVDLQTENINSGTNRMVQNGRYFVVG